MWHAGVCCFVKIAVSVICSAPAVVVRSREKSKRSEPGCIHVCMGKCSLACCSCMTIFIITVFFVLFCFSGSQTKVGPTPQSNIRGFVCPKPNAKIDMKLLHNVWC